MTQRRESWHNGERAKIRRTRDRLARIDKAFENWDLDAIERELQEWEREEGGKREKAKEDSGDAAD